MQAEIERRMSELTSTVNKLQQQQQSLSIQMQKAEAERVKQERRAQEALRTAPAERPAPAAPQLPQKTAAEAANEAAAVKELQDENKVLKSRIAALEAMLSPDALAELVRGAVRAEADADAKAGAGGMVPRHRPASSWMGLFHSSGRVLWYPETSWPGRV